MSARRQPEAAADWFASQAGRVLLESQQALLAECLQQRPGLPWLVLSPQPQPGIALPEPGLWLYPRQGHWCGSLHCRIDALPLVSESVACIIVQHPAAPAEALPWLGECARVLLPGGRLWLSALNPLSPCRRHWFGQGVPAHEPFTWRRALRTAGLQADGVARGVGPSWRLAVQPQPRQGAGARAVYWLEAEKRRLPLTPVRASVRRATLEVAT